MEAKHGPATERVRHWSACSDSYLRALAFLPDEEPGLALPRETLTRLALACRLKAFICAARGGVPGTGDLARLVTLAGHCGLVLAPEELQRIVSFARQTEDTPDSAAASGAAASGYGWVERLCESISRQTEGVAL